MKDKFSILLKPVILSIFLFYYISTLFVIEWKYHIVQLLLFMKNDRLISLNGETLCCSENWLHHEKGVISFMVEVGNQRRPMDSTVMYSLCRIHTRRFIFLSTSTDYRWWESLPSFFLIVNMHEFFEFLRNYKKV